MELLTKDLKCLTLRNQKKIQFDRKSKKKKKNVISVVETEDQEAEYHEKTDKDNIESQESSAAIEEEMSIAHDNDDLKGKENKE